MKKNLIKILFVDDEPWGTEPLRLKLEGRGLICKIATDMSSALKLMDKEEFKLVVMDIMMPAGVDFPEIDSTRTGIELAIKIKKRYPYTKIICLSVIGDQRIIYSLKKKGVLYLRKGETSLKVASKLIESKATGVITF
jgi:CheY-like chemotaxis protein